MINATPYRVPAIVCDAGKLSQVAIIQELGRLGIPVIAVAESPRAMGFASKFAKRRLLCRIPSHDAGYVRFLVREVPPGVVFCSNDANAENISRGQDELRSAGFRLLIAGAGTMATVTQKDLLYRAALECGIAVPPCHVVCSIAEAEQKAAEHGWPAILKATNLAGGVYRFLHRPEDVRPVFEGMAHLIGSEPVRHRNTRLMVQRWISQEGALLWNFNACVRGGEILSFSMGKRIRTDVRPDGTLGSVLLYGRSEFHAGILEANRRLLEHLKFNGILETEWSETFGSGQPLWLYDFNPRPSGNIRWTAQSGVSLVEQYYRVSLGLEPVRQQMKAGTVYVKLICGTTDPIEAITSPRLGTLAKIRVLLQDAAVLVRCRRHAIDVFCLRDPGPTLRAAADLAFVLRSAASRIYSRFAIARAWRSQPRKCAS